MIQILLITLLATYINVEREKKEQAAVKEKTAIQKCVEEKNCEKIASEMESK